MNSRRALVLVGVLLTSGSCKKEIPEGPTFAKDIAPIVFERCAPCHRPDQAAPFSLLSYDDVKDHAEDIAEVVKARIMPPWRPRRGYGDFENDRSLTDAQVDVIVTWFARGAPLGDADLVPPQPSFPSSWRLGTPDLIVEMPTAFTVPAEGDDIYRNFVVTPNLTNDRHIAAWELDPGNARVVHHAIISLDRERTLRTQDGQDGRPGFEGMDPATSSPDGFYLVWAPGNQPRAPVRGRSWGLSRTSDLVLQLHLQSTGRPEPVRARIGLYFASEPPDVQQITIRVGDRPIDIAPGQRDFKIEDTYVLPVDVKIVSAFPHAHYLGKAAKSWAVTPAGAEIPLLDIPDWDFSWQDKYVYREPVTLPAGSVLHMSFSYDNSADNPRNPSHPPVRVVSGRRTNDEMGNITFETIVERPDDYRRLKESKYRREVDRAPTPRAMFNLANALIEAKQIAPAIDLYRRALELDGGAFYLHFNLANALMASGNPKEAEQSFLRALKIDPRSTAAMINLAALLRGQGRADDATQYLKAALAIDGTLTLAHANLGVIASQAGRMDEALGHFTGALEHDPKNVGVLRYAAKVAVALGRSEEAIGLYERFVAERPRSIAERNALAILLAKKGDLPRATIHLREVVAQAPNFAGGRANLVQVLRQQNLEDEAKKYEREGAPAAPR